MANVIVAKKLKVTVDGETINIIKDLAFQAHMIIGEMAGNLIKYAAADTVIEQEES